MWVCLHPPMCHPSQLRQKRHGWPCKFFRFSTLMRNLSSANVYTKLCTLSCRGRPVCRTRWQQKDSHLHFPYFCRVALLLSYVALLLCFRRRPFMVSRCFTPPDIRWVRFQHPHYGDSILPNLQRKPLVSARGIAPRFMDSQSNQPRE